MFIALLKDKEELKSMSHAPDCRANSDEVVGCLGVSQHCLYKTHMHWRLILT